VTRRVCSFLPWPLSTVCGWVTELVEVVETVWEFVCEEVIERVINWIEVFIVYVEYALKWVCWVVDWVFFRGLDYLLCRNLRTERPKILNVCVKILTDSNGNPAIPVSEVELMMADAASILERCNIRLAITGWELVQKEEYLDTTTCEPSGMASEFFVWFSNMTCSTCSSVTVFFVRDIVNPPGSVVSGCAYPGTSWVTVDAEGDGTVVIQEIGHLADLWGHSSDPNNVMTDQPGGTHDQITPHQCCMIRTAGFTSTEISREGFRRSSQQKLIVKPLREPYKRKKRGSV